MAGHLQPCCLLALLTGAMTPCCTPWLPAHHCLHAVQVHAGLARLEVSDERPGVAALELGDMLFALGLPGQAGSAWQQGLVALSGWTAAMGLKEMQVRVGGGIDSVLRWKGTAAGRLLRQGGACFPCWMSFGGAHSVYSVYAPSALMQCLLDRGPRQCSVGRLLATLCTCDDPAGAQRAAQCVRLRDPQPPPGTDAGRSAPSSAAQLASSSCICQRGCRSASPHQGHPSGACRRPAALRQLPGTSCTPVRWGWSCVCCCLLSLGPCDRVIASCSAW